MKNLSKFQENEILKLIFDFAYRNDFTSGEAVLQSYDYDEAIELAADIVDIIYSTEQEKTE